MSDPQAINLYDYVNYRIFLKDKFEESKRKNPLFSYRSFHKAAGLKCHTYLQMVIHGDRDLADDGIRMIAKGFRLTEQERRYFELLVRFNQATTSEEKERYFGEMSRNKKFLAAKPLTAAQYQILSHWYYVAILELIRAETDDRKDAKWIQNHLNPPVGLVEIRQAIRVLQQVGLLSESEDGHLERKEAMLTSEDEIMDLSSANFHVQMCEMAGRAVLREKGSEREFSSLTVVTSEKSFQRAKEEIQQFRKRLHSILEQEQDTDHPKVFVSQVNLQLFRLNKTVKSR